MSFLASRPGRAARLAISVPLLVSLPFSVSFADGAPPANSSDSVPTSLNFDFDDAPIELRGALEAEIEGGGFHSKPGFGDAEGANGPEARLRLRRLWYLEGDFEEDGNDSQNKGFLFAPGIEASVRRDSFSGGTVRHEVRIGGVALHRRQYISRDARRRLSADERAHIDNLVNSIAKRTRRIEKLNQARMENCPLKEESERGHCHHSYVSKIDQEKVAVMNFRNDLEDYRESLRIDENDEVPLVDSTSEVVAMSVDYVNSSDESRFEQNAVDLDLVTLGGHKGFSVNDVDFDICGKVAPIGLIIGDIRLGEETARMAYSLNMEACLGARLGDIAHLRATGEMDVAFVDTEDVERDSKKSRLTGTLEAADLGGSGVGVYGRVERDSNSRGDTDGTKRSLTTYSAGVRAAW